MSVDTTGFGRPHRESLVSHEGANEPVRSSLPRVFLTTILLLAACMAGLLVFFADGKYQLSGWNKTTGGPGSSSPAEWKIRASDASKTAAHPGGETTVRIFSDTAMIPRAFNSFASCRSKMESSLLAVGKTQEMLFKIDQRNIAYLRFEGPSNNYVIRCFDVSGTYRIFISGASSSVDGLNRVMKLLYEVIEQS